MNVINNIEWKIGGTAVPQCLYTSRHCRVVEKIGLSEKIVKIFRSMYVDSKARYKLGTDWVKSENEVRQGCILSPMLLSTYT